MRAYIYDVSDSEDGQAVYIGRRPADNFEEYEAVLTLYYDGRIGHCDEPEWPDSDVDATTGTLSTALAEAEKLLGIPDGLVAQAQFAEREQLVRKLIVEKLDEIIADIQRKMEAEVRSA